MFSPIVRRKPPLIARPPHFDCAPLYLQSAGLPLRTQALVQQVIKATPRNRGSHQRGQQPAPKVSPAKAQSPWENGYCESFNSKLRDELLNGEIFYSLREAQVLIEQWRNHYNTLRPHSALGYRPPAPQTVRPNIIHLDHAA